MDRPGEMGGMVDYGMGGMAGMGMGSKGWGSAMGGFGGKGYGIDGGMYGGMAGLAGGMCGMGSMGSSRRKGIHNVTRSGRKLAITWRSADRRFRRSTKESLLSLGSNL